MYEPRRRELHVVRVEELSTTMRRVVLTGDDLEPDFPFPQRAATDHVKLAIPDPTTGQVPLPEPGDKPTGLRDYTIRRFDAEARELTLDLVVHEHGAAGRWAAAAAPGAKLGVLGPRGSQIFPADCSEYLLVADETALPATERFLEELPLSTTVRVVVLAAGEPRALGGGRNARITWLPEAHADSVVTTVSGMPLASDAFAFGAGEAGAMAALRRHLRHDRGLPPERMSVRGYWKLGSAGNPPADA
ncbi:siderophore-interacting protein [Saccharopolyspora griseoalba]|uniref:Siderophore-interacting protein n=1 Tax=Saccharopolyspora griseoalba TaxID=1431848 RepID=A0ABW2LGU9_9PSEU